MSQIYQINLTKVLIKENAFFAKKEKGYNVLEVNLIYPRSGVPVLKSMRILNPNQANKEKRNDRFNTIWSWDDDCVEAKKFSLLFKEEIIGEAYLEFFISTVIKSNKFEKLIMGLLLGGAKTMVDGIELINSGITSITSNLSNSFLDAMKPKVKKHIIGYGIIPFPDPKRSVNLIIPNSFKRTAAEKYNSNGSIKSFYNMEFKKGMDNGEIEFTCDVI